MKLRTTAALFAGTGLLGGLYLPWNLLNQQSTKAVARPLQKSHVIQQPTDEDLKIVYKQIHEGMTFKQVSLLVPSIGNSRAFSGEHGGAWYSVSSLGGYTLGLRFEHSTEGRPELGRKKLADCQLNMEPGLSDPRGVIIPDHHVSGSSK